MMVMMMMIYQKVTRIQTPEKLFLGSRKLAGFRASSSRGHSSRYPERASMTTDRTAPLLPAAINSVFFE